MLKILIVDDGKVNRLVLSQMTIPYGKSHTAGNGLESIMYFRESLEKNEPYDLIFLDIFMPDMDGPEVLQKMRKMERNSNPSIKPAIIIMVTGMDQKSFDQTSVDDSFNGFLYKPVKSDDLQKILKELDLI